MISPTWTTPPLTFTPKLDKTFFNFTNDLYICASYIPPINSSREINLQTDYFHSLLEFINKYIEQGNILLAGDFNSTSDIRLKDNIQVIEDPLAKLIQIEGVSFNWKENNKPALGVIADQVQEILPELVTDGDPKTVNYNGLIGLLIEVVKDQQKQINTLSERISKLE